MIAKIERKLHEWLCGNRGQFRQQQHKTFLEEGSTSQQLSITFDWIIQRLRNFMLPGLYGLIYKRLTMIVTLTPLYCCFFLLVKAVWIDIEQTDNDC